MIIIKSSLSIGKHRTKDIAASHFKKYLKQKQKNAIKAAVITEESPESHKDATIK